MYGISESDLEQATLKLNITEKSKGEFWVSDIKFAECPRIVVRQQDQQSYSRNLRSGTNDIIGDLVLPSPFMRTDTYLFIVEARLPDGRTLFNFEFEYYLEGSM